MNDLADDGFHEIQLSGKQLVFLFMATTIVAVVIFLCGVQVGRGVRSDRAIDGGDSSASAAPPPAAATQGPRTDAPAAQSGGRPGGWIVQLMALKDRSECVNLAQRLVSKGYPAFVLDPAPGSPAIYRVQVGGYPDRDKADQAARRLEKEEQYKTYVRSR